MIKKTALVLCSRWDRDLHKFLQEWGETKIFHQTVSTPRHTSHCRIQHVNQVTSWIFHLKYNHVKQLSSTLWSH